MEETAVVSQELPHGAVRDSKTVTVQILDENGDEDTARGRHGHCGSRPWWSQIGPDLRRWEVFGSPRAVEKQLRRAIRAAAPDGACACLSGRDRAERAEPGHDPAGVRADDTAVAGLPVGVAGVS